MAAESMEPPSPPERREPVDWEHYGLWKRVQEALLALPSYFNTQTIIEGMLVTDICTLNGPLGATIEEQVVHTLNQMRPVWDPEREYQTYSFVRQPQTFPDVLLHKRCNGQETLMGIELKGWYLLAKEKMPNFRFKVSPRACNPWDLIVVVPWVLSNVLAGSPVTFTPFVEVARYAAGKRNYYWEHERDTEGDKGIKLAADPKPYPSKSDRITDEAMSDSGGNFGRLARYGVLTDYTRRTRETEIRGIPASEWQSFFGKHAAR